MDKAHILDGNNFFSRVFFAGGRSVSSVIGAFIKTRQKYKGKFLVTFDTTKSERRLKLYPKYKDGRKSSLTPEEYEVFKKNLNALIAIVKNMKVAVLEGHGYEADDYVAILCKMLKRYHVHIHSTDQDFLQLVSDRITVMKPDGEGGALAITPENFFEVAGVPQKFFVDYKAMVGDKSDNIPGIDGIGPGKASKYINEYGCYEDIIEALKPKLCETKKSKMPNETEKKILNGMNSVSLARTLVDLSLVYDDENLKNLVREKVKNTKLDLEAILETLTEVDSEECFDVVRAACKTFTV